MGDNNQLIDRETEQVGRKKVRWQNPGSEAMPQGSGAVCSWNTPMSKVPNDCSLYNDGTKNKATFGACSSKKNLSAQAWKECFA